MNTIDLQNTLSCQKHLFDIPDNITYLNCAFMSPLLHSVKEAGVKGVGIKSHPWNITPEAFFAMPEKLRSLFARLLSVEPDCIALAPSVSYAMAVAANNLPILAGQHILVLEDQFPSHVYPWRELAKTNAATIRTAARPTDGDWTNTILNHIDAKTAIIALPQYHWTDGSFIDLAAIREAIGDDDSAPALVLDVTQSLGAAPLDIATIRPDFLAAGLYKWLMGPYGIACFYAAPRYHQGAPIEHNWTNRADSENLAGLVDYKDSFQPGARRFDMGGKSGHVLPAMACAGLEQILDWQPEQINQTTRQFNSKLRNMLSESDYITPETTHHMMGIRHSKGEWPASIKQALQTAHIHVSYRGDCMRIAPHLYNTEDDMQRLAEILLRDQ